MSHDFRISQEKVQKNGRRHHAERRILMTSFQFDEKNQVTLKKKSFKLRSAKIVSNLTKKKVFD